MHYAEQAANAAKAAGRPLPGSGVFPPVTAVDMNEHGVDPYAGNADPNQTAPNEFRARFHRPLVAPSPFRTYNGEAQGTGPASTSTSGASGAPQTDPIDPHLTAASAGPANAIAQASAAGSGLVTATTTTTGESRYPLDPSCIDPNLGQARGGAASEERSRFG